METTPNRSLLYRVWISGQRAQEQPPICATGDRRGGLYAASGRRRSSAGCCSFDITSSQRWKAKKQGSFAAQTNHAKILRDSLGIIISGIKRGSVPTRTISTSWSRSGSQCALDLNQRDSSNCDSRRWAWSTGLVQMKNKFAQLRQKPGLSIDEFKKEFDV